MRFINSSKKPCRKTVISSIKTPKFTTKMILNFKSSDSVFYENYRRQLIVILTVNLIVFSHGIGLGWATPMLLRLQSTDSPLTFNISVEEASWIGAFVSIGGMIGNFMFGVLLDLIGRKNTLFLLAVPHMIFWSMIFFANDVGFLYAARVFGGTTGGGVYVVIPLVVAEIADPKVRGTLGSIFCFSLNIGMLMGNILAAHVPYLTIPSIVIAMPIVYLIFVSQYPETPQYLLRCNQIDAAEKSLRYYKNIKEHNKEELEQFKADFNELKESIILSKCKSNSSCGNLCTKSSMKGLLLGLVLMIVLNFGGPFTILTYASLIFAEAHSSMDPNTNTIIIAMFQIIGIYLSLILIDKFGRKVLMLASTFGMFVGFSLFGVHSYLVTHIQFTGLSWLPLVLMSFIILSANIGVNSVSFILLVEILPAKIRSFGVTLCLTFSSIICFVVLKLFPLLMVASGLSGAMWMFAIVAAFGFFTFLVFLKETKGKNLNDDSTLK